MAACNRGALARRGCILRHLDTPTHVLPDDVKRGHAWLMRKLWWKHSASYAFGSLALLLAVGGTCHLLVARGKK